MNLRLDNLVIVMFHLLFRYFFFFKQKTAYEMRISDWSSDVCSSDLRIARVPEPRSCGRGRWAACLAWFSPGALAVSPTVWLVRVRVRGAGITKDRKSVV